MADIFQILNINVPPNKVFEGVSTPKGLEHWWTKSSEGKPGPGATYELYFGLQYNWKAIVTQYTIDKEFELKMINADADWLGTKVGFLLNLNEKTGNTKVSFYHVGWPDNNEHYRVSCYCWAMYLRILKRYLEYGEEVSYEKRLNV